MKFTIRGVEIMNDDPSSVQSLYGKVESDTLQQIADGIHKRFIDAGSAQIQKIRYYLTNGKLYAYIILMIIILFDRFSQT